MAGKGGLGGLYIDIEARLARFESDMSRAARLMQREMTKSAQTVERAVNQMRMSAEREARKIESTFMNLGRLTAGYLTIRGAAAFGRELARINDGYINIQASLRQVTSNQAQLTAATRETFGIAQRTYASFESTAMLVGRTSRALASAGYQQNEALKLSLKFSESINNAFILSGAKAIEAKNAILQLSQGLASGRLRGDEYRSVAEQGSKITEILAKNLTEVNGVLEVANGRLGITTGRLRELAYDGKLTTDLVVKGMIASFNELSAQVGAIPLTIERAWQGLTNAAEIYVGESKTASEAAQAFAHSIKFVADNFETIGDTAIKTAQAVGLVFSTRVLSGVSAYISAQGKTIAADQARTLAAQQSTAATVFKTKSDVLAAEAEVNLARANYAAAESLVAQTTAAKNAAAQETILEAQRVKTMAERGRSLAALNSGLATMTASQTRMNTLIEAETILTTRLAESRVALIGANATLVAETNALAAAEARLVAANGAVVASTSLMVRGLGAVGGTLTALVGGPIGVAILGIAALGMHIYELLEGNAKIAEAIEATNKAAQDASTGGWSNLTDTLIEVSKHFVELNGGIWENVSAQEKAQISALSTAKARLAEAEALLDAKLAADQYLASTKGVMDLLRKAGPTGWLDWSIETYKAKQQVEELRKALEDLEGNQRISKMFDRWATSIKSWAGVLKQAADGLTDIQTSTTAFEDDSRAANKALDEQTQSLEVQIETMRRGKEAGELLALAYKLQFNSVQDLLASDNASVQALIERTRHTARLSEELKSLKDNEKTLRQEERDLEKAFKQSAKQAEILSRAYDMLDKVTLRSAENLSKPMQEAIRQNLKDQEDLDESFQKIIHDFEMSGASAEKLANLYATLAEVQDQLNNKASDRIKAAEKEQDVGKTLLDQMDEQIKLLMLSNEQREVEVALIEAKKQAQEKGVELNEAEIASLRANIEQRQKVIDALEAQRDAEQRWQDIVTQGLDGLADAFASFFADGMSDTKSFLKNLENLWKQYIQRIIAEVLKLQFINPIINSMFGTSLPTSGSNGGFGNVLQQFFGGSAGTATSGGTGPLSISNLFGGSNSQIPWTSSMMSMFQTGTAVNSVGPLAAGFAYPGTGMFSGVVPGTRAIGAGGQAIGSTTQTAGMGLMGYANVAMGLYTGSQAIRQGNVAGGAISGAQVGTAIMPGIGTIVGAIIGGLAAAIHGKPKPDIRLGGANANVRGVEGRFQTDFGTVQAGSRLLRYQDLQKPIQDLDHVIMQIAQSMGDGVTQVEAIRSRLSTWSLDLRGSAATAEAVLGSRFNAILSTFAEDIQTFVGSTGTLEERVQRLSDVVFLQAAAEIGTLSDDFLDLARILGDFRHEGESIEDVYARVAGSTLLLEDAIDLAGVSLDLNREQFIEFATAISEAAGGLDEATELWQGFFQRFYKPEELTDLGVSNARDTANREFGDIGLNLEDFLGENGMRQFRELFEETMPNLSAEATVNWLQAANALADLNEAQAAYNDLSEEDISVREDQRQAIEDLLDANDQATSYINSAAAAIGEVNQRFADMHDTLTDNGATLEDYLRLERQHQAALEDVNSQLQQQIKDILGSLAFDDATAGMSEFERELANINHRFDEAIAQAADLGATEEQLAQIRQYAANAIQRARDAEAERLAREAADRQQQLRDEANQESEKWWESLLGLIDQLKQKVEALEGTLEGIRWDNYLSGLSEFDRQIAEVNRRFDELADQARDIGDSPTVGIIRSQIDALLADRMELSGSGVHSGADMRRISVIDEQLRVLNQALLDIGDTSEQLTEIERLRNIELQELAANQLQQLNDFVDGLVREDQLAAMTEAERALANLNAQWDENISRARELRATEEQIAMLERLRANAIGRLNANGGVEDPTDPQNSTQLTKMLEDARKALLDLAGTPLENELRHLVEAFEETYAAAYDLGASEQQLNYLRSVSLIQARKVIEREAEAIRQAFDAIASAVATARQSLRQSVQQIRSSAPGYDSVAYARSEVDRLRAALDSNATPEERIAQVQALQEAIRARYDAEVEAVNNAAQTREEHNNEAMQEQERLHEEAMRSWQSQIEAAKRLRDFVGTLGLSENSPLTAFQRFYEAQGLYQTSIGGNDPQAMQQAAQAYLEETRKVYGVSQVAVDIFNAVRSTLGAKADLLGSAQAPAFSSPVLEEAIDETTGAVISVEQQLANIREQAIADMEALEEILSMIETDAIATRDTQLAILQSQLDTTLSQLEAVRYLTTITDNGFWNIVDALTNQEILTVWSDGSYFGAVAEEVEAQLPMEISLAERSAQALETRYQQAEEHHETDVNVSLELAAILERTQAEQAATLVSIKDELAELKVSMMDSNEQSAETIDRLEAALVESAAQSEANIERLARAYELNIRKLA